MSGRLRCTIALVMVALTPLPLPVLASGAADAFAALRSRVGHWQATTEQGRPVTLDYALTARGTVLLETWAAGTPAQTLTVYHLDGTRLLATHYCAQGNQPRLRLSESDATHQRFTFLDATGLKSPDDSHLHRLQFQQLEDGAMERTEVYQAEGRDEISALVFRKQP